MLAYHFALGLHFLFLNFSDLLFEKHIKITVFNNIMKGINRNHKNIKLCM